MSEPKWLSPTSEGRRRQLMPEGTKPMPNDELVEKVARAIYLAEHEQHGIEPNWGRGGFKTSVSVEKAKALAALKAHEEWLREPKPKDAEVWRCPICDTIVDRATMITAALAEE